MKQTNTILFLNEIVDNTASNIEGIKLYCILDKYFIENYKVILVIDNNISLASSFLNSSLGTIIDNYGYDYLKSRLKPKCNNAQLERLKSYLNKYNQIIQN